jgi:GAF domain-containing protein/HAMP domain-containing protein
MGLTAKQQNGQKEKQKSLQVMSLALILFAVLLLVQAIYKILFIPDLAYRLLVLISLGLILTALTGIGMHRKGHTSGAALLMIGMVWIVIFVTPVFFSASGFILALLGILFGVFVSNRLFSQPLRSWIAGLTLVIGLLAFFVDWYGSELRPELLPDLVVQTITILVVAITFLVLIVRFRSYQLQTKLIIAFMIISAFSAAIVAMVSIINARNSLRATAGQALLTASLQASKAVDSFIDGAVEAIETEAQLPVFQEYLKLPADQRTVTAGAGVNDAFHILQQRASINRMSNARLSALQAYMLLDQYGEVVADTTQTNLGLSHAAFDYFRIPIDDPKAYVSPVQFDRTSQPVLFFGTRVNDINQQPVGVLVVLYSGNVLQQITRENNNLVGDGSFGILVDDYGLRLGQGVVNESLYRFLQPLTEEKISRLKNLGRFPGQTEDFLTSDIADLGSLLPDLPNRSVESFRMAGGNQETYLAAKTQLQSQTLPWQVIYVQSEKDLLAPIENQVRNTEMLALLIALAASFSAIPLSRLLTAPVRRLKEVTGAVTSGNLNARAKVETDDEIGSLAIAINQMTDELQQNLIGLEQRVSDRTRDLEKRLFQLQAVAEIGRAAATIRNPEELFPRVTRLISERLNYYHVGIFLLDAEGKYAVLRAANSDGGLRMLARGHRLGVGQQGIVGYVTGTGNPRIALDVGEDSQYFNNPDLPMTRSEMSLPLTVGGKIMGALDVQSTQASAFGRDDVAILQVMADLVAIAIENARLFTENQEALETSRRAYGELSRRAWMDLLSSSGNLSFTSLENSYRPEYGEPTPKPLTVRTVGLKDDLTLQAESYPLSLPIKVRDIVIGYLDTYKPGTSGSWTPEEYDMVTTIIDQLGVALESARLYGSSQSRAERERLIGEVTSRMRESLDVDAVLRTAVQELRRTLGLAQVEVRMKQSEKKG